MSRDVERSETSGRASGGAESRDVERSETSGRAGGEDRPASLRLPQLLVGVVAVLAGAVLLAVGDVIRTPWVGDAVLVVTALCVVAVAVFGILVRSLEGDGQRGLPGDRFGPEVRTPGDDVDDGLADAARGPDGSRDDVRRRFEDAAAATLARRYGCSRATARERLAAGTWTDDEAAAAFFAEDADDDPTVRERVGSLFGRETTFQRRAARATLALLEEDR